MINVGGRKVSPAEIENHLKNFPGTHEAVVVPMPNIVRGVIVVGVVERNCLPGTRAIAGQPYREYLLEVLPEWKIPAYFVETDKIPLGPSGKPDRSTLLQKIAAIDFA